VEEVRTNQARRKPKAAHFCAATSVIIILGQLVFCGTLGHVPCPEKSGPDELAVAHSWCIDVDNIQLLVSREMQSLEIGRKII
jgi:hypothetical protein